MNRCLACCAFIVITATPLPELLAASHQLAEATGLKYMPLILATVLILFALVVLQTHRLKQHAHQQKTKPPDDALLQSQKRYQSLFNNSPMPLWEEDFSDVKAYIDNLKKQGVRDFRSYLPKNPEHIEECAKRIHITDVNNATLKLHEAETKEDLFNGLPSIFTEKSYEAFQLQLFAIAEGRPECELEGTVKTLTGKKIEVSLKWLVVPGYEETLEKVYISTIDITEQKRAEAGRERLLHAIGQVAETILITDASGTIEYVNPAFERISGYTREEAIGQNPRILKSGEQGDLFYRKMWNTLTQGKTWSGRIVNRNKDGSLFTEEAIISPVFDKTGKTVNYVAVKRDITHELIRDAQLRQAQKMEAVGRLAGGVAHDFNNMLSIIIGHADMILDETDASHPTHEDLQEIKKAGERSADLTRQLLTFARKQTVAPKVIDLNNTLEGMTKMLERLIGEDIDFAWLPGSELWPVKIDPTQIDQILTNLCVNARDAISGVGKLTIETRNISLNEAYCADHLAFAPGDYVMLAVSDDGPGMDAETRANLFEPFFTTKETGKGTGLGLATVYGVVKQNSGFINVYSEPGHGTTFIIFLPRHYTAAEKEQTQEINAAAATGNETILLVEDERAILKMASSMLEREGYTVMAADSPGEAIRLASEHSGTIHLLITDVIMPEMNGRDLAKNIQPLYPGIKCLFMSGYTANVVAHHGVLNEGVNFIQKPFSKRDMTVKVREVLDRN